MVKLVKFLGLLLPGFYVRKKNPFGYKKMKNLVQMCSETTLAKLLWTLLHGFYERKKNLGVNIYQKSVMTFRTLNIIFIDHWMYQ